jgi:hypothetical protein
MHATIDSSFSAFTIWGEWPPKVDPSSADHPARCLLFSGIFPCLCVNIFIPPYVLRDAANAPPVTGYR